MLMVFVFARIVVVITRIAFIVVVALTTPKGLVLVRFAVCGPIARAMYAVSTKDQVHVRSCAFSAVILGIVIGIQTSRAVRRRIQLAASQTLFAVLVPVKPFVGTHALVLVPVKHKVVVAVASRRWALVT
jgi:hypothetical protein